MSFRNIVLLNAKRIVKTKATYKIRFHYQVSAFHIKWPTRLFIPGSSAILRALRSEVNEKFVFSAIRFKSV